MNDRNIVISQTATIGKLIRSRQPAIVPPSLKTVEQFLARATGSGDEQLVHDLRRMLERDRGGQWT